MDYSFHHYPNQKNELIINIEKWWEDDGYNTGLEKWNEWIQECA